ncbi:MAG: tRNA pseudouridine(38-40) synthase TruA [Lysobacteraceae bacterium]
MRYALGIEYDGTAYAGWQKLGHAASVQGAVEAALSAVAAHEVEVICAGRTDSGVHGRCQVVHFDSDAVRSDYGWTMGANANLPPDISVLWARQVAEDFSARFSARARRYRYRLLNRKPRPALEARYLAWEKFPLDAQKMHQAAQALIGEQDFSAFRASQCQATHARRQVQFVSVTRIGEEIAFEIQANAFLHHMVRNIVGSLCDIGRGAQGVDWIAQLLEQRDRTLAGPTAEARGLVFLGPLYPKVWNLPPEVTLP